MDESAPQHVHAEFDRVCTRYKVAGKVITSSQKRWVYRCGRFVAEFARPNLMKDRQASGRLLVVSGVLTAKQGLHEC